MTTFIIFLSIFQLVPFLSQENLPEDYPLPLDLPIIPRGDSGIHSFDMLHYDLDIEVLFDVEELDCTASLLFEAVDEGLDQIRLDLSVMEVDSVWDAAGSLVFQQLEDSLFVNLSASLSTGDSCEIFVSYGGDPFSSSWSGFKFNTYQGHPLAYNVGMGPESGRWMYPCWDDIFDKASYTFHITVDDTLYAVAGGELSGIDYATGKATFHWNHPEPISTYIAALAVSDYIVLTEPACPLIKYYVWSEWEGKTWASFVNVPEMMDCYEQFLGSYPWNTKFSNVIMDNAGYEHNTNVFLSAFFVDGTLNYEYIFAHELSHHWWGNLVTESDWPEIWLAEGFATYSEALWQEYKYGPEAYTDWILETMETYLNSGELFPVVPATEFWTYTVYNKGGSVLHMLRHIVGDEYFFDALKLYLTEHAYSSTTTPDLIAAIETTTGSDIDWFFDTWIYDWGYPVYNIDWSTQQIGDDWDVTIDIEQIQSVGPVFTMPLDFLISGNAEDSLFVMWNDLQFDTETFTVPFEPVSVEFDPGHWVLHGDITGFQTEPADLSNSDLSIYPNPALLSVEVLWNAVPDDTYSIDIFDISGCLQISTVLTPDNRTVDISGLPSGSYLVLAAIEEMKQTSSLVVAR